METLVNAAIRTVLRTVVRMDTAELARVPPTGPLILYANHTGQLEVPLLYTALRPRPITGLAKRELWDNRALRRLLELWGAIPIRRGVADPNAMREALSALREGKIVAIAPEGTLSGTGVLATARSGIVALAIHSGAPVMPLAHWGIERLSHNLKRMRRTEFNVRVGPAFKVDLGTQPATRTVRQAIVDEMMFQLAALLPEAYRGAYAGAQETTDQHLVAA